MRLQKLPIPGRNTPCSCGSGRKFKKCCIQAVNEIVDGTNKKYAENLSAELLREGKIKVNDKGEVEYVS
jgi:hypothetical protein